MSDELKVNGSCHCEKIKIEAKVKKSDVRACHCSDCQKMSGAPFRAIVVASSDKISIEGRPKEYVKIADSGNRRIQAFCGNCGTHLFATDVEKNLFNLRTGFLAQKNELKPKEHVFTKSLIPWIKELHKI